MIYTLVAAGAIATYVSPGSAHPAIVEQNPLAAFFILLTLALLVVVVDILIPRKRIEVISATYFGLLIGVLLSFLLLQALEPVIRNTPSRTGVVMITTLILPYLSISLLMQTKDDFRFIIPYVEFSRELKGGRPMILDSSALIDGRIGDLVETKIIDSEFIIPEFILQEVQNIADSSDKMRRMRGRRGLDVISKIQSSPHTDVRMYHPNNKDLGKMPVDQRLVIVAQELDGRIVTNDFNLNKVASVQGVDVINLNDVSNSLKPRYLPGERLRIRVTKEGESQTQGVGYLDDGTMVVCEHTNHLIGQDIDCVVTSVLQSSAGRMIFAKLIETGSH